MIKEPTLPTLKPPPTLTSETQPRPTIGVIIPTWGSPGLLKRCLRSLLRDAPRTPASDGVEIIAVDDGSCVEYTLPELEVPGVSLVRRAARGGFAATCNTGAEHARSEWLVFLNDDAFVTLRDLRRLVAVGASGGAAIIGPQLIGPDGRKQDSMGSLPCPAAIVLTKLGRLLGTEFPGASHRRQIPEEVACEWVSGACLAVRAEVFRDAGSFDTEFTYFEDADLCARVRRQEETVMATSRVTVVHIGGATFTRISAQRKEAYRRSRRLFFRRHCRVWP